jgi:hypothetical protein
MFGKILALLSALCVAAIPGTAAAQNLDDNSRDPVKQDSITQGRAETGGKSYGDRNRGGRSGFYSFPRHNHIDGRSGTDFDRRQLSSSDAGIAPYCDNCHGSAYYGRNYGAPYFDGGYYDRGVYYRERRPD